MPWCVNWMRSCDALICHVRQNRLPLLPPSAARAGARVRRSLERMRRACEGRRALETEETEAMEEL